MILPTINLSSLMWVKMKSFIKVILSDVISIRVLQPCLIFISTSKNHSTLHSTYNNIFIKNKCKPRQPGSRSWSFMSRVDGLLGNRKLSMSCLLWMSWNVKSLIIDLYCSSPHNMRCSFGQFYCVTFLLIHLLWLIVQSPVLALGSKRVDCSEA